MRKTTSGFTIVELLVVIVVIAILAAISIVAYNGIQDRTRASTVQNDLANAKKKMMLYKVEKGKYPADTTQLAVVGVSASKSAYNTTRNNFYYCYNIDTDEFAIGASTISDKASYVITSSGSLQQVASIDGGRVCQAVGLASWDSPNGWINNGHNIGATGPDKWQAWISG